MTNPVWAPALWSPLPFSLPEDPGPTQPENSDELEYDPWEIGVYQTADWTCSCASSAWLLNAIGDRRLGRRWQEWDVVDALRNATYWGAVTPSYGLARADMADLETMFNSLGYRVDRKQHLSVDDVVVVAGRYALQINGARWYHHSGARAIGPGVLYLANPSPNWRGVGAELDSNEASLWGTWNGLWVTGRL